MHTIKKGCPDCIISIIIISFLFHGIPIIFFTLQSNKRPFLPLLDEQTDNMEQEMWASRNAQFSLNDTPIMLLDNDTYGADSYESHAVQQNAVNNAEVPSFQDHQHIESDTDPGQRPVIDKATQTGDLHEIDHIATPLQEKKREQSTKTIAHQLHQQQTKPQKAHETDTPTKKIPTLSQLAQGFLHSQTKGNDTITVSGSDGVIASEEQIKRERYIEKLFVCLHNSLLIVGRNYHSPVAPKTAAVYFVLHKNGSLKTVRILDSTGIYDLDELVTTAFYQASNSFPPVPEYIPAPFEGQVVITLLPSYTNQRQRTRISHR